jgi:tRNA nucleotidyltransferase/poly(A) polymerase
MKKYRAELNKYNRQKGTYGNGDKKDASHKNGKISGYEDQSKNRGRREKSRLKKEEINENKITLRVPNDIKKIYKLFRQSKKELYIVGGAVRDAILGKSPKDFDLATNAKPDEVEKIAKKGGFKTISVGKKFGVVVVGGHEIATFRKDIGKGRRPKAVDFSDIKGDVNRRDLTINSLFYDIDRNEVVDLTGGLQDLKDKIVRTVGKASERFDEDPLRKLRALRFQAVIGGKMDKDTEIALMKNPSLTGVSRERIREEFIKGIQKGKSQKLFMEALDKFGFTKQMFPKLNISKPYPNVKDFILFLAIVLRTNKVDKLPKILNQLKYSGDEVKNITFLVYLNDFKPSNIYNVKKAQEKTTLTPNQIISYGKMIGKDFKKLVNFKLSVRPGGKEFVGLKGPEIGDKIKELEKKLYLGEGVINEAEPKFQSVHTRSSFDQTFGGFYANYVPLSTKFMQKIIGKEKVSVFHVGAAELKSDIQQVGRIVGKKSSLSTFTAVDKGEKLAKGQGIQSKGGVIYQIEGTLLVASTRDIQSTPDKTGRRWVPPYHLAGKGAGGKMYDELKKGVEKNKIDRREWDKIQDKVDAEVRKKTGYGDTQYDHQAHDENLKKALGPYKREWIKKYIDMCYKIMRKYAPQIKRHILSQKDKKSEHGWNEIVVNQIHIQDVFMLKRVGQYDSIRKEVEKIAKGKVTVGTPAQFRKWYNERGGIINEEFGAPAGVIPSPSRKGVKKNKTNKKSGYKKVENLQKNLDSYMKKALYLSMENGDNATISEQKIKKVVGIYGGRYQPFGPHHLKTYKWLKSQVDDAYITTSDIKKPPRHPMNFAEKVRHMVKMGVPKNRIVKEKVPLKAENVLKKYDPATTAVIYIFGEKDAGRLAGGKKKSGGLSYFQDYKKNKNNLKGYEEHGYFMTAPHQSVKVGGKEVSGTVMRQLLGSPDYEQDREKLFKQAFGYYDKGVFQMMNNKFKKLFETIDKFIQEIDLGKLLKEASDRAAVPIDDGPPTYYDGFDDYKTHTTQWINKMYITDREPGMGWEIVQYILSPNANDPGLDFTTRMNKVPTVAYGRKGAGPYGERFGEDDPVIAYKDWIEKVVGTLDFEILKWMGLTPDTKNVTGVPVEAPALPGVQTQDQNTQRAINLDLTPAEDEMGDRIKQMQESFIKETKELLLMGGAYGHMSHPFDDNNLTFSDLKTIIINGIGGKLDREDGVTEKLDGQNLMVSWIDGKLKAARNKGHLRNFGKTAPDTKGVASIFSGRGDIKKAFVGAMRDLEKAIGSLSDKQKEKVFGNGKRWMNLEVMYPATANVIDYDVAEIVFHGTLEYDESGRPIGQPKDSARMLAGMIKQVNQSIQKTFKIGKPNFLKVPKHQDYDKLKNTYLGRLKRLQSTYGLNDKNTLGEYHEAYWREYIFNASKQFGVKLKPAQFAKLVRRWAYFDKSYKIQEIRSDYKDNPKFVEWIVNTDKFDHTKIFKDNIKPFEVLFFDVGAQILKNISGYMAVNPDKSVQKVRDEMEKAYRDLSKKDNIEKLKKLKTQIEKLNAIGGLKSIVPSEGIVFKYKGKVYKFTGAFAPINQILGSLKFG